MKKSEFDQETKAVDLNDCKYKVGVVIQLDEITDEIVRKRLRELKKMRVKITKSQLCNRLIGYGLKYLPTDDVI